jgi:hypothetical protein
MPDQNTEIRVSAAPAQHRHVFGEGLESPVDAGAQRVEIHALDDCQIAHDQIAQMWRRWDDPEPAIADDGGRDPERGGRRQHRVPGDLRVIMGVQVDDAGHQREPAGIDDVGCGIAELANRGDASVADRNVSADRVVPEPIDHGSAADHEVMHRYLLMRPL